MPDPQRLHFRYLYSSGRRLFRLCRSEQHTRLPMKNPVYNEAAGDCTRQTPAGTAYPPPAARRFTASNRAPLSCLYLFLAGLLTVLACQTTEVTSPGGNDLYGYQYLDTNPLQRIAFGSCNRENKSQSYWAFILEQQPDLWIWMGDNIYADTDDMEHMAALYDQQKRNPFYAAFRQRVPVIGVWDDHDYGLNDGGSEFDKKEESAALALDFLDVAPSAPVRQREGVYQSYTFGPEGREVKIILLDTRYFRDELEKDTDGPARYEINETGDILGEQQWAWLREELTGSSAQIHLIGSSIQIIPAEQGFEKWANFPRARQRLFDLLAELQPANTVLLSGDRHIAEISRIELPGWSRPLTEITSSGLTHSYEAAGDEPNRYRISPLVGQRNFGLLEIDWSDDQPRINFELRHPYSGKLHFSQQIR